MEETLEGSVEAPRAIGRWVIDPVHSQVGFTVIDRADLKIIGGRFTDFSGEVLVGDDGRATISGVLKVASVNTDDDERDHDLRSADYLDAHAHPEFRLEASEIDWRPDGSVAIDGSFSLRGPCEPIRLEGELIGVGRDGKGDERVAVITSGSLHWGALEVRLTLGASAIRDA
jgi:polyisoprenoid-binding protein YceI